VSDSAPPRKPIPHYLRNADGTVTEFFPVPFMTLEEARAAGPQMMADPNFVQAKIDAALQAASQPAEEGEI